MMVMRFHYNNLSKHNVSSDDVVEAIFDSNGWTQRFNNGVTKVVGKTFGGQILEICYRTNTDGSLFVFHAMRARDHQKKRYKKRL